LFMATKSPKKGSEGSLSEVGGGGGGCGVVGVVGGVGFWGVGVLVPWEQPLWGYLTCDCANTLFGGGGFVTGVCPTLYFGWVGWGKL